MCNCAYGKKQVEKTTNAIIYGFHENRNCVAFMVDVVVKIKEMKVRKICTSYIISAFVQWHEEKQPPRTHMHICWVGHKRTFVQNQNTTIPNPPSSFIYIKKRSAENYQLSISSFLVEGYNLGSSLCLVHIANKGFKLLFFSFFKWHISENYLNIQIIKPINMFLGQFYDLN